jgi:hypothetical protein
VFVLSDAILVYPDILIHCKCNTFEVLWKRLPKQRKRPARPPVKSESSPLAEPLIFLGFRAKKGERRGGVFFGWFRSLHNSVENSVENV